MDLFHLAHGSVGFDDHTSVAVDATQEVIKPARKLGYCCGMRY